jgi:hypothetical protein
MPSPTKTAKLPPPQKKKSNQKFLFKEIAFQNFGRRHNIQYNDTQDIDYQHK